jgi:hypothetical protein
MPRRSDAVAIACAALLVPLLASAQAPIRVVGPLPSIFRTPDTECATSSRTFDGSTQYFSNANGSHAALEAGVGQDVAFELWFYLTSATGLQTLVYQGGVGASVPGVWAYQNNGRLYVQSADGAATYVSNSAVGAVSAGSWHKLFIICDRDGDEQLYLDDGGALDASPAACPDLTFGNTSAFTVGSYLTNYYINGRMAGGFPWWVGADLSGLVASSATRYNGGVPLPCSTLETTYGATACWPMDGAAGANEADQIGSVTLTQVNSPGSADGPGLGCQ